MGAINISQDDKFSTEVSVEINDEKYIKELLGLEHAFDFVGASDIEIIWKLDLCVRSWGIKDLVVIVPDQAVTLEFEYFDEEQDDYVEVSKDIFLKNVQTSYVHGFTLNESIAPSELECINGKWVLVF